MGHTVWCCSHWTISYDNLLKLCTAELPVVCHLAEDKCDGNGWRRIATDELMAEEDRLLLNAFELLQRRFTEVTGGLTLNCLRYEADMDATGGREVSPYEEIVFIVGGVVDFTQAGKINQRLLCESSWIDAG